MWLLKLKVEQAETEELIKFCRAFHVPRSAKPQKSATALFNQVFAYYFVILIGVRDAASTYGFLFMLKTFSLNEEMD